VKIAFAFDARSWAEPRARWTIATLAPLLDTPWRELPPGEAARPAASPTGRREREAIVFVGDPAAAPASTAVSIPLREGPAWRSTTLVRSEWDGVSLPVPGGRFTTPSDPGALPGEWLPALWQALSREEERQDPRRDQWECFSGAYTRLDGVGLLETPFVNLAAATLRARLDAWCGARGAKLETVPRWKDGARFAVALSHDVDDVRLRSVRQSLRLLALARSPRSYALRGGLTALKRALGRSVEPDPYAQFERWIAEETRRGFRSTFFAFARPRGAHEFDATYALGDPVPFEGKRPRVGAMLRALAERGFEIGLHGSYRTWRDPRALAAQRAALAAAVGREVTVTRQHFLRLDPAKTFDAQEAAGFTADSTLGYNERIGFRAGIAAPFHPWNAAGSAAHALLEVPLTLMDGALFRGMSLSADDAERRTIAHLEGVERANGLAGLLWHPNAAAEALFPGWWRCFVAALDHLARRGAWVTTTGEIAAWWGERERRLHVAG
jgi:peptidoglycan/xylan/chitin deacetylase (PgdA/CDA1 family)